MSKLPIKLLKLWDTLKFSWINGKEIPAWSFVPSHVSVGMANVLENSHVYVVKGAIFIKWTYGMRGNC